jgi:hypothetical protein
MLDAINADARHARSAGAHGLRRPATSAKPRIAKARREGLYRARPEDVERNTAIMKLLERHVTWADIVIAPIRRTAAAGKSMNIRLH